MKSTILFLLLPIMVLSQNAESQFYTVGKGIENIIPSERRYLQYTESENGLIIFQSILTRKIEEVNRDNKPQLLITQTYQMEKFKDVDSSFCLSKTLLPSAYFTDIQSEGHKERVYFSNSQIENTVIYADSMNNKVTENKGLYNGVILEELIATMPLKNNSKFLLKLLNPGLRYFEYPKEIAVLGQETLEIAGLGEIKCWKIVANPGKGNETMEWYSVKDQIQIKKEFKFKNGSVFYRILLANV